MYTPSHSSSFFVVIDATLVAATCATISLKPVRGAAQNSGLAVLDRIHPAYLHQLLQQGDSSSSTMSALPRAHAIEIGKTR